MKKPYLALATASGFTVAFAFTQTLTVSLAFSLFLGILLALGGHSFTKRTRAEYAKHLPEVIDHLISGIQSGLSLTETLSSLAMRGPAIYKPIFADFQSKISLGHSFEESMAMVQERIAQRSADQLFESLLYARELGGTELVSLLRQLGSFVRSDLTLREEIESKQSWVRNSAHLSASAPWILLLLLSTQESTSKAYSTISGLAILVLGLAMTSLAYLWMGYLSKMPQPSRIFGNS